MKVLEALRLELDSRKRTVGECKRRARVQVRHLRVQLDKMSAHTIQSPREDCLRRQACHGACFFLALPAQQTTDSTGHVFCLALCTRTLSKLSIPPGG